MTRILNSYEDYVKENVNTEDENLLQFAVSDFQDEEATPTVASILHLRRSVDAMFSEEEDEVNAYSMTVAELIECLETCDYLVNIHKG